MDSRFKRSNYYLLGLANKELDWFPMDSMELFYKNLKSRRDLMVKYGWTTKKVSYKFNGHGFRSDEFSDSSDSIMFLGCSNTLGIGIPYEETWAYLVSRKLGLVNANLGQAGGSPDYCFRICSSYIDRINPKIVVYNQPPWGRIELLRKGRLSDNIMLSQIKGLDYKSDIYLQEYILEDMNIQLNYLKNRLAIEYLCSQRDIKFLFTDCYLSNFTDLDIDLARDLDHRGTNFNRFFSELVLSSLSR